MRIYKVVPCPGRVVGRDEEDIARQIGGFSNIIIQESVGGWELVTSMPVAVTKNGGKKGYVDEPYNALVFAKEVIKEEPKKL